MRMSLIPILLVLLTAALICAGCESRKLPPVDSRLLDPNGNFTLHVSNQSFAITPVDIQVQIDGERVVHEYFDVGNQHGWKTYKISLAPGKHKIQVTSAEGNAELSQEIEVTGQHWGVIDYWHYPEVTGGAGPTPKQFSFSMQDSPIGFM